MISLLAWGWLSGESIATLLLACEVGASADEHQRFNEMRLVAHVVLNRMESSRFVESTTQEVALAPRQFSCVGDERWRGLLDGTRTQRYPRGWPPILETARLAWRAAQYERGEWGEDPTRGATFYFSPVSMRREWYNINGTMPRGWPTELEETTPAYVDASRFRFFAFPDELKLDRTDYHIEADLEEADNAFSQPYSVGPASYRIDSGGDDGPVFPSPGAPSEAGDIQPAGRGRPHSESGGR